MHPRHGKNTEAEYPSSPAVPAFDVGSGWGSSSPVWEETLQPPELALSDPGAGLPAWTWAIAERRFLVARLLEVIVSLSASLSCRSKRQSLIEDCNPRQ
jgi:hypothetical protein